MYIKCIPKKWFSVQIFLQIAIIWPDNGAIKIISQKRANIIVNKVFLPRQLNGWNFWNDHIVLTSFFYNKKTLNWKISHLWITTARDDCYTTMLEDNNSSISGLIWWWRAIMTMINKTNLTDKFGVLMIFPSKTQLLVNKEMKN